MVFQVESEKEGILLQQLKAATSDLDLDEETLLRFLRAREWNLTRAEDMLRKSLKWRKDMEISSYRTWEPPAFLKEDFIYEISGLDNEGRPVVWVPLAIWKAREFVEAGYKEDVMKFRYHLYEVVIDAMKKVKSSQITLILGFETLTYWKVANFETMQILYTGLKDLEANYPEILKRCLLVNAPWIFPMAYNFCKPIFSKRTLDKFKIFNSDKSKWLPVFLEIMPKESLPTAYRDVEGEDAANNNPHIDDKCKLKIESPPNNNEELDMTKLRIEIESAANSDILVKQ